MHTDSIERLRVAVTEMELRFSFGYTPDEFATTLARLATGVPGADLLVTSAVDLPGAPGAFEALRTPGERGKILVMRRTQRIPIDTDTKPTDTEDMESDDHH